MKHDDIVQTYAPDKQKLAELVIQAKGNKRTMAQFANDTGISAPTLSRIANGRINNPLSKEFLEKIYGEKCDEADYSFDSLLLANGMVKSSVVERGKNFVEQFTSNREQGITLERHAKNAIINAVMDRGITIQSIHPDFDNRKKESPFGIHLSYDFSLNIPSEKYQFWYFQVIGGSRATPPGNGNIFNYAVRLFLLDAWTPEFLENQKTSFVFENRIMYEQFIMRFKGAPLKSAVSAILINAKTEEVIEETWISASPEVPSILAREITNRGDVAVWSDEDLDEYDVFEENNE